MINSTTRLRLDCSRLENVNENEVGESQDEIKKKIRRSWWWTKENEDEEERIHFYFAKWCFLFLCERAKFPSRFFRFCIRRKAITNLYLFANHARLTYVVSELYYLIIMSSAYISHLHYTLHNINTKNGKEGKRKKSCTFFKVFFCAKHEHGMLASVSFFLSFSVPCMCGEQMRAYTMRLYMCICDFTCHQHKQQTVQNERYERAQGNVRKRRYQMMLIWNILSSQMCVYAHFTCTVAIYVCTTCTRSISLNYV